MLEQERRVRREAGGKCREEGVGESLLCPPNDTPESLYLAVCMFICVRVCVCVCVGTDPV